MSRRFFTEFYLKNSLICIFYVIHSTMLMCGMRLLQRFTVQCHALYFGKYTFVSAT